MKRKIYNIVFYIICFIVITIICAFSSVMLDKLLSNDVDAIIQSKISIKYVIEDLKNNEKSLKMFELIELLGVSLTIYFFAKKFKRRRAYSRN